MDGSGDNASGDLALLQRARLAGGPAGPVKRSAVVDPRVFDIQAPAMRRDVLRIVMQYLRDEGLNAAANTLQDEADLRVTAHHHLGDQFKHLRKALLDGDWIEVDKLVQNAALRENTQLQYSVYRQHYLELVEQMDFQKAFTLLSKRLKPLELQAAPQGEFRDLCYLLTCRSVQEAPAFKQWEGIAASREKLVEHLAGMLELGSDTLTGPLQQVPPQRLIQLLGQAVCYQIEGSRYHPRVLPRIATLMEDYTCFLLPNANKTTFRGHRENVKCVDFVGEDGTMLISGSSDNTLRVWRVEEDFCLQVLSGHSSRIWDVSSNSVGDMAASASGDSTVQIWDLRALRADDSSPEVPQTSVSTLNGHEGDVYSVKFHPANGMVASGGYDKTVRLWDVATGTLLRTLRGHSGSVARVTLSARGNLAVSASKDSTIRFWDLASGICIKTLSSHLGEVTSVEMNRSGSLLLSGSKDNSNRLWDLRLASPIQRFKGHQNTSKNFVRAEFGPNEDLIVGGSEDGLVYIWSAATGEVLQRLGSWGEEGHRGTVYRAIWNSNQSLLASCSHDSTIKTWWYDEACPLVQDDES